MSEQRLDVKEWGANAVPTAAADMPEPGAWRTVVVLTLLYWLGTMDRQIAALLIPNIKVDLALTDLQISLIQGLAFGLFFMLASPLMGWLVDRYSRRAVLFCGVVGWSLSAAASGLARSFGQLFAARAGVGAFEASINPTAYAMLSDLFPPRKLSLPMSIFVLGGNLGTGMSFVVGGAVIAWIAASPEMSLPIVGTLAGWQVAFLVTGIPGVIIAPIIWLASEKKRHRPAVARVHTTFGDLWRHVRRHPRFYAAHNLGFAAIMAYIVGLQSWNAAYISREFGWPISSIGYSLGIMQIVFALAGLAFHGWAVDRLFSRGRHDAHLIYFAVMAALAVPTGVGAYMIDNVWAMLTLYNLAYFFLMSFASIGPAALQIATPPELRGKASAIYMVILSIIGSVLGPIIVASFTDVLFGDEKMLGHSMALFAGLTGSIAAILFMAGRAPMRRAIAERLELAHASAG